ncbi:MAG: nuclear transport factor 2 family protein [Paracoccaceae bacterium]
MTPEQLVRIIVTAYQERDLDTVLELTSEDIVFENNAKPDIGPHCANVSNKTEFLAYLKEIDDCWEINKFTLDQLVANGGEVATRSQMDYVSKATSKRVITQAAHFWTIADGKVSRLYEFYDTAAIGACK